MLRSTIIAVMVFSGAATSATAQSRFLENSVTGVGTLLSDTFSTGNSGMGVGLVDESGIRVVCAGRLDNGSDDVVNGDTVFELGSVTKVFTALLLFEMASKDEVQLDSPVNELLPSSARMLDTQKPITLLNLAAQDSGLPWHPDNLTEKDFGEDWRNEQRLAYEQYSVDDLYAFLSTHKVSTAPGERFQYSNVGMGLLGHTLGLRANKDYEELLIERICRPLRMGSTVTSVKPPLDSRLARGHWSDGTIAPSFHAQTPAFCSYP